MDGDFEDFQKFQLECGSLDEIKYIGDFVIIVLQMGYGGCFKKIQKEKIMM